MATLEELVVQLTAETSGLKTQMASAVKATESATEKMDQAIKSFADNSSKNTNFFQTSMATMTGFLGSQAVLGAFNAVKDAAGAFINQLKDGAQEAMGEERALAVLNASLAANGNFSKEASNGLNEWAASMEATAQASQQAIVENLSLLSSLTKLDSEGLKKAENAAINLAAATGKDLSTATEIVAKAINGQATGLNRLGVNIDLTADKTQNLEIVTSKLASQFGGAAKARTETFSGALFSLNDAWGDLFKELAKGITQNDVVISVMSQASKVLSDFTTSAQAGGFSLKKGIGEGILFVADGLITATQVTDAFIRVMMAGFKTIYTAVQAVGDSIQWLGDKLGVIDDSNPFQQTSDAFDSLSSTISGDSALNTLGMKLADLKEAGAIAFAGMTDGTNAASEAVINHAGKVKELTSIELARRDVLKSFVEDLAKSTTEISGLYETQLTQLQDMKANELITEQDYWQSRQDLQAQKFAEEQSALEQSMILGQKTKEEYAAAESALRQRQADEKFKLDQDQLKAETETQKTRTANLKSTFGYISSLASSQNKELAAIGKAAAISQATMDTYAAANVALKSAPPPFNFGLAAAVVAAGIANVAKITGTGLKTGIDSVPGVGKGDSFPAVLAPGERVVPSKTNQDLTNFLEGQNSQPQQVNITINIPNPIPLNREAAEAMVETINNYIASGGLRILQT